MESRVTAHRITFNVSLNDGNVREENKAQAGSALVGAVNAIKVGGSLGAAVLGMVNNKNLTRARRHTNIRAVLAGEAGERLFSQMRVAGIHRRLPPFVVPDRWKQLTGKEFTGSIDYSAAYCEDAAKLLAKLIQLKQISDEYASRHGRNKQAMRNQERAS